MWGKNKANANEAEEHYNRGQSLFNRGRYNEALSAYESCLRCNPGRQQQQLALSGKLFTLDKLKRYPEALCVAESIASNPINDDVKTYALCMRAKILYHQDDIKEARIQLYEVLQRDPHSRLGILLMSEILLRLEEYREALELIDKAILSDTNFPEFYYQRGRVMLGLKRYLEALVGFETALHFDPTNEKYRDLEWIARSKLKS